jgi:hypothetical protein
MNKGKILATLAVCALVFTSAVTPAGARWGWRGYGFVGHNTYRPPAGQIWVRGFRNAPTREQRLRQDFQFDGAFR